MIIILLYVDFPKCAPFKTTIFFNGVQRLYYYIRVRYFCVSSILLYYQSIHISYIRNVNRLLGKVTPSDTI